MTRKGFFRRVLSALLLHNIIHRIMFQFQLFGCTILYSTTCVTSVRMGFMFTNNTTCYTHALYLYTFKSSRDFVRTQFVPIQVHCNTGVREFYTDAHIIILLLLFTFTAWLWFWYFIINILFPTKVIWYKSTEKI